jgi:hypothetical protein
MLRRKETAAGRVWLLLRHLDRDGRGWVTVDEALTALSADHSPLRICGRRQATNLLAQGEGLYWDRGTRRVKTGPLDDATTKRPPVPRRDVPCLWLRSTPRVAAALGVERLSVAPVAVEVAQLTRSIGHVRAHLFASFHSGRQKTDLLSGRPQPRGPIARETMQTLAAVCPNSQRRYERRAGVVRQTAFAIGPEAPARDRQTAVAQETAWQRGRAHFTLTDRRGRFGPPGRTYLAWQLPNEYTGPHRRLGRGRMKRMNRALADLLPNGMTGNSERPAATRPRSKRFFGTAKAAWTAERRHTNAGDMYWRGPHGSWRVWREGKIRNYELGIRNEEGRGEALHVAGRKWQVGGSEPQVSAANQPPAPRYSPSPIPNS